MFDLTSRRSNKLFNDFNFDSFFTDTFKSFKTDIQENNTEYKVFCDLPGLTKENINIAYNNNHLVITTKEVYTSTKGNTYIQQERYNGEMKRSFYIDNVNSSEITAKFNNGVLEITLPKLHIEKEAVNIEIKES